VNHENVKMICFTALIIAVLASCTVSEVTRQRVPIGRSTVEQDCAAQFWMNDYCRALAEKAKK